MTDTLMDRMTNEIPLPEQWRVTKLGDVVLEHKSGIYKKRELFGTGYNIVGVSDLYENTSIDGQTFNLVPLTEDELDVFDELADNEEVIIDSEGRIVRPGDNSTRIGVKTPKHTFYFIEIPDEIEIDELGKIHYLGENLGIKTPGHTFY